MESDKFVPLKFEIRTQTSIENVFEEVFGLPPDNRYRNINREPFKE